MNVPHPDKIIHQTFNASKLEFVWKFNDKQVVLGIKLDGIYLETGTTNSAGDYIGDQTYQYIGSQADDYYDSGNITRIIRFINPEVILDNSFWNKKEEYNFFSNGKDMIPLIKNVIEYLK